MALGPFEEYAGDLAPGDRSVVDADWSEFAVERVSSVDHPLFGQAYARLWAQFGASGGMERREVIAQRLAWDPQRPVVPAVSAATRVAPSSSAPAASAHAFLYEMLVVRRGDELVAVRDHTAILPLGGTGGEEPGRETGVVVHLSHVLVEPSMRGRGLAGWLRALPLQAARECAAAAGLPAPGRVTLVAEMEHADGVTPAVMTRLRSYARAGFRTVDPGRVPYHQPDFRSAAEIDRTCVQPIPLGLVIRRVGREHETDLRSDELRAIVAALFAMFAVHVRSDHMGPLGVLVDRFSGPEDEIALLSPLHAVAPSADTGEGDTR